MRRIAVAGALTVALAAVIAPNASAMRFGGVVTDVPTGTHLHRHPVARAANLPYGGGPVLHSNRTWVIFWQPQGSGLGFDPGYEQQIVTFLKRVAADSRLPTNVYSLSGQYHDSTGPAAYNSTFGGAVVATDRLPGNGCVEPDTGPGWSLCLTGDQLQSEIVHVVRSNRLPTTGRDVYFLVTPNGLGNCEFGGPDNCALGGSANGSFCGYHSVTSDSAITYAVIPFNAVSGHCQSDNPRPNGSTADPVLSTLSHEHNEMITDPQANGWIDGSGNENGDLCISEFGPGGLPWNEVIHGGRYFIQYEWSNDNFSCQPRDEGYGISFNGPRHPRAHKQSSFTGFARDPDGSIVNWDWFFGDGGTGHRRQPKHTYRRAGRYKVTLRTTDYSGNWAFSTRTVTVFKR